MKDTEDMRATFDLLFRSSELSLPVFSEWIDSISSKELSSITPEMTAYVFAYHRGMAERAIYLLNDVSESLAPETELEEIRSTLQLGIRAIQLLKDALPQAVSLEVKILKKRASGKAKTGAEALHNKLGGSRSKAGEIRRLWASGKFKSRDDCAEQECAALGMAISTARRALRNTPAPD